MNPRHAHLDAPKHKDARSHWAPRRLAAATLVAALATVGVGVAGVSVVSAASRTWYVAPTGSDAAGGDQSGPLATVNAAVSRASSGDTIYLRGGTYHQQVTVSKDGLTLRSFPGEKVTFDGTSAVTGWRQSGAIWVRDGWTTQFDNSPTYTWGAADGTESGWGFVNPSYPMASWPDQVFFDGQPFKQVKTAAEVKAGTFAVDYPAQQLIIGSNPTGHAVRASTLDKAMSIRGANTVLSGFGVIGFAPSVPHMGTITLERPGIKVDNVEVSQNATTGISAIADNISLTNVTSNQNGMLGIHASGAYNLALDQVEANGNNVERFNQAPVSGGIKVHRSRGITIQNSQFSGNYGTGIWFDVSNYSMNLLNNQVRNNTGHGIFLEISDTGVVAGNVVANNGGHGLQIDNTGHVKVWNNTFLGNARPLNVVQDSRLASDLTFPGYDARRPKPDPTVPWITEDIQLSNNVVAKPSTGNCLLCVEDYTKKRSATTMGVRPNGNLYQRISTTSPNWLVVWSSGSTNPFVYTDLKGFQTASGQEVTGQLATSDIVDSQAKATATTTSATSAVAQPLPADVAALAGQPAGSKTLGAWSSAQSSTPPPANKPPTASFVSTSTKLSTALDGSTSSDADGTVISYAWDFGDGTTGTGRTVTHTFPSAGSYSVKLTVTDDGSATAATTKVISVVANKPPTAAFASTVAKFDATFDGAASADTDGTLSSFAWNFGDGATGTGRTATHTYAATGTYSVTLTVTDNDGAKASVTKTVTVPANGVPTASFKSAVTKLDASFDASASSDPDGTVVAYAWDFGDGTSGTGKTATHAFAKPGNYIVKLTVTDNEGATAVGSLVVTVPGNLSPTARFAVAVDDMSVSLDATGSTDADGSVQRYEWDFGDGMADAGASAVHRYAALGSYTVTLTVTDDDGATATAAHTVVVPSVADPGPSLITTISDLFARNIARGWGMADTGGAWSVTGSKSNASVGGGTGTLTMQRTGTGPSVYVGAGTALDSDLTVKVSLDKVPFGRSGGVDQGVVIRKVEGKGDYRARLRFLPGGGVRLGLVRTDAVGVPTVLVPETTIEGVAYSARQVLNVRVQAIGTGQTTLQAKVWPAGTSEPAHWTVSVTDLTPGLQTVGATGFHSYLSSGVTNAPIQARFDDLTVVGPAA